MSQTPEERDVYERIFAEARNVSDLRRAIARAVRQLREAMEKEDNCAVTAAHLRNLTDIAPEALARAYTLAEKTCTYWPSPGQIRELAGWSEEMQGGAALGWVFRYLEKHGVRDAPKEAEYGSERMRPDGEFCWKRRRWSQLRLYRRR